MTPGGNSIFGIGRSMTLNGASVQAVVLKASIVVLLQRPQWVVAIRVIRGYRTNSFATGSLLARIPPWDLKSRALAAPCP